MQDIEILGDDHPGEMDVDVDILMVLGLGLINAILEHEPIDTIKVWIDQGAPLWFQDEDGTSPLHAAAYVQNSQLVKLLIDEGAVWNAVDNLQNTAGDIALSLNNEACYNLIRDAGIRSEMLLTLLSSKSSLENTPSSLVLRQTDASAAGSSDAFLSAELRFTTDEHGQDICIVKAGEDEVGVMMGWERDIMRETVQRMSAQENLEKGLKVLNVGFGLGIIDSMFQSMPTPPSIHVIVEPHPDVLKFMKEKGWYEKKGVVIIEGKWQDLIDDPQILGVGGFDAVYTDTFSEDYEDLHTFFKHVPDLLSGPKSIFSFFNGLGATNALFYDVYTRLADMHLSEVGLEVKWDDVDVNMYNNTDGHSAERWGQTRQYFTLPTYRLPCARMKHI